MTGGASQRTGLWPDGETQVVFIVGDPIAQVNSPAMLPANFAARGVNAVLVPGHVAPQDFATVLAGAEVMQNMPGIIMTVPHKQAAAKACATMTDRARVAGSVNVMRKGPQGWMGDNTDGMGYLDGMAAHGGTVAGKAVLLVGAGGAGSAIAYEILARGASRLAIHDTDDTRRDDLVARLADCFPDADLSKGSSDPTGFDVIANATPLGMRDGDPMPVDTDKLTGREFAACPITKPDPSPFIAAARAKGCGTMTGSAMFKAQEDLLVDALLTLDVA
jgi:shikimate dehydrogenase